MGANIGKATFGKPLKVIICVSDDQEILFPFICPIETHSYIHQKCVQFTNRRLYILWDIHLTDYYIAIKINSTQQYDNLTTTLLSGRKPDIGVHRV